MGILGLKRLLADVAPNAMKANELKNYFGRKIAIDAWVYVYQFLVAVRSDGSQLTNASGEVTSHLMGTFYRTIRLVENGIKPVYVFDGSAPKLKSGELNRRAEKREGAQKGLEKAEEEGDIEQANRFTRRLVKVTKEHAQECKHLLKLMGIPYVDAPCEAEAQCAALVKAGKVYATATEDMDALTFGSNIMLTHFTVSETKKLPVQEVHLDKVLAELEITQAEFIDLCILLGCDYCESIRGIGPKRAFELIKKHRSLEEIIKNLDTNKYTVPENWMYKEARELFINPEIADPETIELKWSEPDVEGLVKYLCKKKLFNEERIRSGAARLLKAKTELTQGRLDTFFKVLPSTSKEKPKVEDKSKSSKKAKISS